MRSHVILACLAAACSLLGPAHAALGNPWEGEILAFEQQDRLAPPPANAIVVTGSSTIAGWYSIRNDLAPLEVVPRGFGGSTADDLDYYLQRVVLAYAPRAVVIYEGDNDIASGLTPQYFASRISQIAGRVSDRYPGARVYVISIKPSPLRWGVWPQMQQANQLLANLCASDPRYTFINTAAALLGPDGQPRPEYYASDTLHLSAAGYKAWTDVVRPVLLAGEQGSIVQPGLLSQDIGAVSAAGSYGASGGVHTLRSGGLDIGGTADAFRYAWQPLTGDGHITARVVSQSNTSLWAKAGVMFREQLTASSRHAFVFVTPNAGAFMQYRTTTGGNTGPSFVEKPGMAAPYWVRLIRQGNVLRGYLSANGIGWTEVSSVTFSNLPSTVHVGLAATSYSTSARATVLFDNVAVTPARSSPPPVVDVTPPSVPTGLKATATSSSQINLTWNASSDNVAVAGYRVFQNGTAVATTATTSYADSGLAANTLYTYTVSAYDGATPPNESAQSTAANAATLPANVVPVLTNPGKQSGTVGTAVSLQVVATDADGDTLTYSAAGLPSGLAINASSGRISGTPTTAGTFNVTLSVSDGRSGTDTETFTWVVVPANVVPVLTDPGKQSGTVGTAVSLQVVATDADGDTLTYSAAGLPSGLAINASSGRISGTPTTAGTFNVTLSVSDSRGGTDTETFTWVVVPANVVPVLTDPGKQSGTVGTAVSLQVVATDANGDTLTYSAAGLPSGLAINASSGRISGTPTTAGTFNVTLSVSDSRGGTDTETFTWVVVPANVVPVLTNPGNQSGTVGTAVSLQVVATDADGDTLTYSAAGLPGGLAINASSGRISGTPTTAGTFNVMLSVSDGRGGTDVPGFSWTIAQAPPVNVPPALTRTGDHRSTVGTAVGLQIVATNPDGDVLAYAATNLPSGLSINAGTGLISGAPTAAGSFDVTITVSDGRGGMDTESLSWIVEPANAAPILTNPGNQNGTVGTAVSLQVVATDPDGNALAYAAANLPSGLAINAGTGLIGGTPNSIGTFNVTLAVSDGLGGTNTEAITWSVAPAKPAGGGGGGGGSLGWAGTMLLGLAGLLARGRQTSQFA